MENNNSSTVQSQIPVQYSEFGRKLKKFLHTPFGAYVGFAAGIQGFNSIVAEHFRFKRFALPGEGLKRGETLRPVGDTGLFGIYDAPKISRAFNSRVNKGADLEASLLSGTSFNSITSPLPPKYIALSTSTLTPAAGDTTLTGETSVAGLARALGTQGSYTGPVALDGACSYVVSKTFTLTGGATTVVSTALFDAVTTGNMYVEANFASSSAMATNDQLAVNWTINL